MKRHTMPSKVVAATAVAVFSLGAAACSDDDGDPDDDVDNPVDSVDDQVDSIVEEDVEDTDE